MPTVTTFLRQFSISSRRKRSQPLLQSTNSNDTSKTTDDSMKERNLQHARAVSEPLPNGYHEGIINGNGTSPPVQDDQSKHAAASAPDTLVQSPPVNTTTSPGLQRLADAAVIANSDPKLSQTEKFLNKFEDIGLAASADKAKMDKLVGVVTTALKDTDVINTVKDDITSLIENTKPFMDALDAVAKIHPFIGAAVTIFQAVWNLEMTRRGNNQKVLALHIEMRNMIGVLVQLHDVKDPDLPGPGGLTIKNRMQSLVDESATAIQNCASACDEYTKKQIIVKVLSGPVWEAKLAGFGVHFDKIRSQFEFQLTIHNTVKLDDAAQKIDDIQAKNAVMGRNITEIMEMLRKLSSPEEKRVEDAVQSRGGIEAVLENETLLKEISKKELAGAPIKSNGKPYTFKDLQDDLKADIDEILQKNLERFSAKIAMQQDKLAQEINNGLDSMTDKLIAKMDSGPHERILDPDIRKLWGAMQWRGSTKARLFVMSLRDYFHEHWGSIINSADCKAVSLSANHKSEEWALPYLDIQRLGPISESIDDDASGFITVNEVNYFISSRPPGWGLLHWIAYWAIGWHQAISYYAGKIREVLAKMFAILPNISDVNLPYFHKYLDEIYQDVTMVEASVNPCLINEALQAKFRDYIESEEIRLKKNLQRIHYNIDAMDTLPLITGRGRIGKFIHCLLYLLLEHHFEIFRLAQERESKAEEKDKGKGNSKEIQSIHPDELVVAASSIHFIIKAYKERFELLRSVFRQQRLDPRQQFENFANGMFRYQYDPRGLWSPKVVNTMVHPPFVYDESLEDDTIYERADKILTYPFVTLGLDYDAYAPYPPKLDPFGPVDPLLEPVLGTWNALMYRNAVPDVPARGMVTTTMLPLPERGPNYFKGCSRSSSGDYTAQGHCTAGENGIIHLRFKVEFKARISTQYWNGSYDPCTESVSGSWGLDRRPEAHFGTFVMKRTDPLDLCYRPAPKAFLENKPAALWTYARRAILSQVRRKAYKWSYFEERAKLREKFFDLYIRHNHFGRPLEPHELEEWRDVRRRLTSADVRFYQSYVDYKVAKVVRHHIPCERCHGQIGKARNICLQCQDKDTSDTFDLCSPCQRESEFGHEVIESGKGGVLPHSASHEVVKVRRVIHIRDFGRLYQDANKALDLARKLLTSTGKLKVPHESDFFDSDFQSQDIETPTIDSPTLAPKSLDPECTHCQTMISVPCWCYINLDVGIFICDGCEKEGKAEKHDLVRCQHVKSNKPLGLEKRLASLEERLESLEQRSIAFNDGLHGRFQAIEGLLRAALQPGKGGEEL